MKSYVTLSLLALCGASALFGYRMEIVLTAERIDAVENEQWEAFAEYLQGTFAELELPQGVEVTHGYTDQLINITLDNPEAPLTPPEVRTLQEFFDAQAAAANKNFKKWTASEVTWSMAFDGEAESAFEEANWFYQDAEDLGEGWMWAPGYGASYVAGFPWIFNDLLQMWYYSTGDADDLWAYTLPFGWVYTTDAVYPWLYIQEAGLWDYGIYVPPTEDGEPGHTTTWTSDYTLVTYGSGMTFSPLGSNGPDTLMFAGSIFPSEGYTPNFVIDASQLGLEWTVIGDDSE